MRRSCIVSRVLCQVLCFAVVLPTMAMAKEPAALSPMETESVQQRFAQRGVGQMVKVVRTDRSEVRGRIAAVRADAVDLQVGRHPAPVTVSFRQVADVKGPGLSKGAKIGIWVGVGVVVTAGVFALLIDHELSKPWGPLL